MNRSHSLRLVFPLSVLVLGAGCTPMDILRPQTTPKPAPIVEAPTPTPPTNTDPYEGWGTIMPGNVISLRIPPGCIGDPAAGTIYVSCPTEDNDTPTPDMRVSSDGMQVNIHRWEDQEWAEWDKVIRSLRIITPLGRDVQINIQK